MEPLGSGNTSNRCFHVLVRCSTIITVRSTCIESPRSNMSHPSGLWNWVEATLTRLYLGKVGWGLGGLKRMKAASEAAAKGISNFWDYLHDHQNRLHYRKFRRGGYPIGSGGIESSNKFICHVRLKRSGAWWYELNSNQMLALRCAKYNGTFDRVFERHQQRLRKA